MADGVSSVRYLLANDSGLTAQVPAARIMAGALPQGIALPAVSVMMVSSTRPQHVAGASGMLAVDGRHTIYWEQSGNPEGVPVVFLHGGPGAGSAPVHRRFFDPQFYRVVVFDRSNPVLRDPRVRQALSLAVEGPARIGDALARMALRQFALRRLARQLEQRMRAAQVNAFLVGEAFMRADDPGLALAKLFA